MTTMNISGDLNLPLDLEYEKREFKRRVFIELIPKYMTTGTATTDASIIADAQADTKRLKAAFDELMKVAP